jgi:hypothetical protein
MNKLWYHFGVRWYTSIYRLSYSYSSDHEVRPINDLFQSQECIHLKVSLMVNQVTEIMQMKRSFSKKAIFLLDQLCYESWKM